ncbi:transporter [Bacteroidia bacterium]|nr:transporter [Bacteroidia bacterium]
MKTPHLIFLLFVLLITPNNIIHAQQKTLSEELQELQQLVSKQKEALSKDKKDKSNNPKIQKDSLKLPVNTIQSTIQSENKPEKEKEEPTIHLSPDKKWLLAECIRYAIDHNINVQQLRLQQEEAEIQQNTAKNSRLPDLNASVNQEWSFKRSNNLLGQYEDWNQSALTSNVQSTIPVFTGFRIPNQIAYTKLEFKVAVQKLEKAKDDLSLNITSLFLRALFAKELYNINEKQLELSKMQVERTKLLVQSGSIPQSQLYDIEAQVAKDEAAVVDAQNDIDLALLDLAQNLELETFENFDIDVPEVNGDIIQKYSNGLQSPAIIYDNALTIKPVIKGQEFKVESSQKALNIAKAGYYPQLDFALGIGSGYSHIYKPTEQINPITNLPVTLNPSFSDQIRDNGNKLIGLRLSIPIFNRYQVRNKVRSARIEVLNQELILENNKKTLYKEIQTAHKNATAAREKYRASEHTVKFASESFKYAQQRYELGKAAVFEFNEAKSRLIQSQSELAQAKYEYILRIKILEFYNGIPIEL